MLEINPFDILSGKVVINEYGNIYYFKEPGNDNMQNNGKWPITAKLHRLNGYAVIRTNGHNEHYINGRYLTQEEFNNVKEINEYRNKSI